MAIGFSDYAATAASGEVNTSGGGTTLPVTLDTASTLLRTREPTSTSLRFPVGPTETTIPVASTEGFTTDGAILVGGEAITYTGKTTTAFTGCFRGAFQSDGYGPAAGHEIGSEVAQYVTAAHHRVLVEAVLALQERVERVLVGVSLEVINQTAYTLSQTVWGRFVYSASASAVTITVPELLPIGFRCRIVQAGAGRVTVAAAAGGLVTVSNRAGHTKTAGQHAVVEVIGIGADLYILAGDTGA